MQTPTRDLITMKKDRLKKIKDAAFSWGVFWGCIINLVINLAWPKNALLLIGITALLVLISFIFHAMRPPFD